MSQAIEQPDLRTQVRLFSVYEPGHGDSSCTHPARAREWPPDRSISSDRAYSGQPVGALA